MLSTPVGRFRAVALVEGVSYLVLLLVAMPLKYAGDNPAPVLYVGWVHGGLFILYAVAGFNALFARGWKWTEAVRGSLAAVIPCGTFVYDRFLRREQQAEAVGAAGVPIGK